MWSQEHYGQVLLRSNEPLYPQELVGEALFRSSQLVMEFGYNFISRHQTTQDKVFLKALK